MPLMCSCVAVAQLHAMHVSASTFMGPTVSVKSFQITAKMQLQMMRLPAQLLITCGVCSAAAVGWRESQQNSVGVLVW